jgi:hypothetical protein
MQLWTALYSVLSLHAAASKSAFAKEPRQLKQGLGPGDSQSAPITVPPRSITTAAFARTVFIATFLRNVGTVQGSRARAT